MFTIFSTVVGLMSIMMSESFQLPNDSKEHQPVKATTFHTHSKSEVDFEVNNVNVKQDPLGRTNSLDTVLGRDALGTERFSRSPSLRISSDIEDNDSAEELGKAIEENNSSRDSNENKIISCRVNKEVEDEIDQLTDEFRSCVMKSIYGETGALPDRNARLDKGLKLKITMTVANRSSVVVHHSSVSSNSSSHRSSFEGRKSFALERTNSFFEWGRTDVSMELETSQSDLGQSKLPLPPRLKEASYRNPLRLSRGLSSTRRDSIDMVSISSFEQLFSPRAPPRKNVQSALSKIVKKQKEISVKLWRSSLELVRQYGRLKFSCWRPIVRQQSNTLPKPDCRYCVMV